MSIRRNIPLKRSLPLIRYTSVKQLGRKMNLKYPQNRHEFLTGFPVCETQIMGENDPESYAVLLKICEKKATTIHHLGGRKGEKLNDFDNVIGLCAMCHQFVDVNSDMAKLLGYDL